MAAEDTKIISRKEAIALGLVRFFTGKPCRHGHISERRAKKGVCVACDYARGKRWVASNKDRARALQREWANKNYDPIKRREWRQKNKDKLREENRKWRKNNPEKCRNLPAHSAARQRERRLADPNRNEKSRVRNRSWRARNPEKKRVIHLRRRAKEYNAPGSHTAEDLIWIMTAQKGRCAYCRISLSGKYHADHIIALSKGGGNHRSNIQLTCKSCNLRKHAKDPIDFAREHGRLL